MKIHNNTKINEKDLFKERLTIALKAAKICVFEVDLEQQLYTFFENAEDIFNVSGDVILKEVQPFSQLSPQAYRAAVSNYFSHPDDEVIIERAFMNILNGKAATYEARMRAGGSDYRWCKIDVTPILSEEKPVKMIGVITDISHIKHQNELLKVQATKDAFTGLYNKEHSIMLIKQLLSQDKLNNHALLLIDVDNFKVYNDTYGHYEGDKALQALAALMNKTFRGADVLGRFGGDEFMIFIHDFSTIDWLCEKLERLLQFQSGEHALTTSIGVALSPSDAIVYDELFLKADKALYHSKLNKGSFTFFSKLDID